MARWFALALLGACAVPRGALDPADATGDARPDAPVDAAIDAAIDAARIDSGRIDAGRIDAGAIDAGEDASVDADVGPDTFDAGTDVGPTCTDVPPVVQWFFGGGTPLDDLAPAEPDMDLEWQPLDGEILAGGASFDGERLVSTPEASQALGDVLVDSDALTVEGWIERNSGSTPVGSSPRRIFTCSRDVLNRAFTVGQRDRELVVRFASTNTNANGDEIGAAFFPAASPRHFAFTWDGRRVRLYVDGIMQNEDDHGGGATLRWTDMDLCLFGDERTGARSWTGLAYALRIWNVALDADAIACFTTATP